MKHLLAGLFALSLAGLASAQTLQPVNSGTLISEGIKLHDQEKYADAVKKYQQVPRNDTNYTWALYEKALSYSKDSNYTLSQKAIEEGLSIPDNGYELSLLSLRASNFDDQGDMARALRSYDSALVRYPRAQNLLLNKGVTLLRLKKVDEAEQIFKDLILQNPYNSSAHFRLGSCAMQKGQVVPAMLSYYTYLVLSPAGAYSKSAISILSAISNSTDDILKYVDKRKEEPSGNFAAVEQILLSKIALDKNYKILTDLDDEIIRQLQVVTEKLEYDPSSDNFWMQFYVPYLKAIFTSHSFEAVVNYSFSDVNVEKIQKYLKKNTKEVKEATNAIVNYFDKVRFTRELNFSRRQSMEPMYHLDEEGNIGGKGKINSKGKKEGPWEYYYENGNLTSTGLYSAEGNKEGKWTYYYDNGVMSGFDSWKNGKQEGEDVVYSKFGVMLSKGYYANGKLNGEKTRYFGIGHVLSVTQYRDDKEDGKFVEYYPSGQKKIETVMKEDELNGPYRNYHENGQLHQSATYEKGKLNGSYKSYFDNGQLETECVYRNGEVEGTLTSYYENGKTEKKTVYVAGLAEGEELEYNEDGVLITRSHYKKGKPVDLSEYFDDDGILRSTFRFENGLLKEAKYFDKAGKEISSSTRQNKRIELTVYSAEGLKVSHTVYNDDAEIQNTQTYFYNSGKIKETNPYIKGKLEGVNTGYFENGKKHYEISYKEDNKEGPSIFYYPNGKARSVAWYTAGDLNGDFVEYNEKGNRTSLSTYRNNDLYGYKESFFPNGQPDDEEYYVGGWLVRLTQYDTLGRMLHQEQFVNGTGNYRGIYANGKTRFEVPMVNGELHGTSKSYFFDGSLWVVKHYVHGLIDGEYQEYAYGGKLVTQGKFSLGKKVGTWKYFDAEGRLSREEPFVNNRLNGKAVYYFDNGKPEREIEFRNDDRHGEFRRYGADGQLACVYYYKDDMITGFSWPDKNGQLVPVKPIRGGSGKVVTYFSNGTVSTDCEFSDGKLHGPYKLYHSNGKLYYESADEYGLTTGKIREYHANGTLKSEYLYYLDNQDGPFKEFAENGTLKEEGNFYLGYRHGTWKWFDASGKLKQSRTYYYGLLLSAQ